MGNHWAVVVSRNNLALLKDAISSLRSQDAEGAGGVEVLVVDNGSTDGTASWLHTQRDLTSIYYRPQHSVARAWNSALQFLFRLPASVRPERVLVVNQDVVLRPDTYRLLVGEQAQFVTAVGSDDPQCVESRVPPRPDATRPHPDFSCFMISRECYQTVGPFDEQFVPAYCEDSDMHCRLHQAGIRAYAIDLPFLHVGGGAQTIKRALPDERDRICRAADLNRQRFQAKWGFAVGSPEYYTWFGTSAPDSIEASRRA